MDLTVTSARLTGDVNRDVKTIANHVFQLEENLRYALQNLDVTNFNDLGLARYENGRMQLYAKEVEVQTEKLRVELGKETDDIYANISATGTAIMSVINKNQNELQSQITQTANEVSAIVTAVGKNGEVTAASIVAAINADGNSQVKIKADKVNISGLVTFSDLANTGETVINADNILTGRVKGVSFVSRGDIDATGSVSNSFVVQGNMVSPETGENYNIGKIGYTFINGEGVHSDKLYLKTEEYYYWQEGVYLQPAVKIFGIGGVSLEAGISSITGNAGPVYISSQGSYVTINGKRINIRDNVGAEWVFENGGLFKNGQKVL